MTNFPSSPTVGQTHTYSGITYKWSGAKWTILPGAVRHNINIPSFGEVDLSKGAFHKISTNDSRVISFANIPSGSSKWGMEIDINGLTKYDLVNSSGTAPVASLSLAAVDTTSYQTFFKPEGDKLFFVGTTNDRVYTYNLSTAWNITTATTGNFFSVAGFDSNPQGLSFDPTGRYMYVGGVTTNTVYQFELSERWNVATATLIKTRPTSNPMTVFGSLSIQFSPAGDKVFILGSQTSGQRHIYEFVLSTPWDISTATYTVGNLFRVDLQDSGALSFTIRPDGRKMYMTGFGTNRVYSYTLPTPWQINTAINDNIIFTQAATVETALTNMMFNPDGSRMFLSGTALDTLREYRTSYSRAVYNGTFTFPTNVVWNNNTTPVLSTPSGEGPETTATSSVLDFTTPDGGGTIYASERFNKPLYKPSTEPPVKFARLLGSLTGTKTTWYPQSTLNVPTGISSPLNCRFVVEWTVPTPNATTRMDIINLNPFYMFNGSGDGFEYAYVASGEYRDVTTWTAVSWPGASVTANAWSATSAVGTPDASVGLYVQSASIGGYKLFLRSPLVTLGVGAQPAITFYTWRPNGGTHNYYITNF